MILMIYSLEHKVSRANLSWHAPTILKTTDASTDVIVVADHTVVQWLCEIVTIMFMKCLIFSCLGKILSIHLGGKIPQRLARF